MIQYYLGLTITWGALSLIGLGISIAFVRGYEKRDYSRMSKLDRDDYRLSRWWTKVFSWTLVLTPIIAFTWFLAPVALAVYLLKEAYRIKKTDVE